VTIDEDVLIPRIDRPDDGQFFATLSKRGSGWYDLNFDGFTDDEDLKIIQQNLGANCLKKSRVSQVTGKPPQP
jgi:hypothetical protein